MEVLKLCAQYHVLLLCCSQDCQQWADLPHVDQGMKDKSTKLLGRFTGRPDHVYEHKVTERMGDGSNTQEQTSMVRI